MFQKLVGNLPYNPSIIGDFAFYAKRLHKEESIRRTGFLFMALAMIVQTFSFISPPQSTLASSSNDIVFGGQNKDDILRAYDTNRDAAGRQDIKAIYDYYGISRQNIVDATSTTINYKQGNDLFSTGRHPNSRQPAKDVWTPISGVVGGGIYQRPLSVWGDINFNSLKGTNTRGQTFWILIKGCGNIVMETTPKEPDLEIQKKIEGNGDVQAGEEITYKLLFRNSGQAVAQNAFVTDILTDSLEFVSYTSSHDLVHVQEGQSNYWLTNTDNNLLPPSTDWYSITIKARVKAGFSGNVCNGSRIDALNHDGDKATKNKSNFVCSTALKPPVCPDSGLPIPDGDVSKCKTTCVDGTQIPYNESCPTPVVSCQNLVATARPAWNKVDLKTTIIAQPGGGASKVTYYNGDSVLAEFDISSDTTMHTYQATLPAGEHRLRAEITPDANSDSRPTSTCEVSVTITEPTPENPVTPEVPVVPQAKEPIITQAKAVKNITQDIADANKTKANAGDELVFTLTMTNEGEATALNQPMVDDIHDILEYADLVDNGGGEFEDTAKLLSWPVTNVEPGQSISKSFTVKIKDPIPSTPVSASDPLSFDMSIYNKFGNGVTVELPATISKTIETTATTLPNTGPSATMLISLFVFTLAAYFLFRTHLISKESQLIIAQQTAGGF